VSIVDHHNRVFSGKGRHVAIIGDLIDFHASGERPRGHEILYRAIVPELVATYDSRGVHHDRAVCLLVDVVIVVGRGCGLLVALLAPLFAAFGALLGILDDDDRQCFPTTA
jgi:hypothetical protein